MIEFLVCIFNLDEAVFKNKTKTKQQQHKNAHDIKTRVRIAIIKVKNPNRLIKHSGNDGNY